MDNKVVEKVEKKYNCECCLYFTSRKEHYIKHLATQKHKNTEMIKNDNGMIQMDNKKVEKVEKVVKVVNKFNCECGKEYKYIQGLYKHKKTCNYEEPVCVEIKKTTDISGDILAQMVEQNKHMVQQHKMEMMEQKMDMMKENEKQKMEMMKENEKQKMEMMKENEKQNKEQMALLTNTIKEMSGNMGSNNNSNNTNNQFNINMFLNEECKDAINMSDFVKSIQVSLDQLQYTTTNGLEKGITRVIMDNMNKLSKYERPLHCSDLKRETLYIKDNDKWEKDTNKEKLKEVIKKTSNKNYSALSNWNKENPNFMQRDDQQNFYARSMSAMGKPIEGVEDKIIKSICKDYQAKE